MCALVCHNLLVAFVRLCWWWWWWWTPSLSSTFRAMCVIVLVALSTSKYVDFVLVVVPLPFAYPDRGCGAVEAACGAS